MLLSLTGYLQSGITFKGNWLGRTPTWWCYGITRRGNPFTLYPSAHSATSSRGTYVRDVGTTSTTWWLGLTNPATLVKEQWAVSQQISAPLIATTSWVAATHSSRAAHSTHEAERGCQRASAQSTNPSQTFHGTLTRKGCLHLANRTLLSWARLRSSQSCFQRQPLPQIWLATPKLDNDSVLIML